MRSLLNSIIVLGVAAVPAFAQPQDVHEPVSAPTAATGVPARSPDGRLLVMAVEATTPVKIDGTLDDEVWQRAQPVGQFVQSEPQGGQPATERTEVRVAFDSGNLYIAATLQDSQPGMAIVNDIKKDFQAEDQDTFEVIIDTFADRRNGFMFTTNRGAARADEDLLIFHSRRIGLRSDGTPLPIYGGARLTGRAGGVDVGLLSMQMQAD